MQTRLPPPSYDGMPTVVDDDYETDYADVHHTEDDVDLVSLPGGAAGSISVYDGRHHAAVRMVRFFVTHAFPVILKFSHYNPPRRELLDYSWTLLGYPILLYLYKETSVATLLRLYTFFLPSIVSLFHWP